MKFTKKKNNAMIIEIFEKINFHNQLQEENLRNKKLNEEENFKRKT